MLKIFIRNLISIVNKHISVSSLQKEINQLNSLIHLMKLISRRIHQDSLYSDVNDLDHARCQVILLLVLFEEGKLLGNINKQFINFLY